MGSSKRVTPESIAADVSRQEATGGTTEHLRALLRRRPRSLDEIAAALSVTRGRALDLADELRAAGAILHEFGGHYTLDKHPGPVAHDDALHLLVSDDEGGYHIGALGDTHLGSKYERLDVLNDLYDLYAELGITHVYHTGNWIDGEARFNRFDIHTHGMQAQLDYFAEHYPARHGITTYLVAGDDHEGWYCQREGVDIGRMMEDTARRHGREDLRYLGYVEAFITLRHKQSGAETQMLVQHPGGGSAYAISYAPQKIVESFQGGEKPAVLLLGHYHKLGVEHIRNVWCVQTGCTKDLDVFGRKKRISYHVGGTALQFWQDPAGAIYEFLPRLRQYFDRGYDNGRFSLSGPVASRPSVRGTR